MRGGIIESRRSWEVFPENCELKENKIWLGETERSERQWEKCVPGRWDSMLQTWIWERAWFVQGTWKVEPLEQEREGELLRGLYWTLFQWCSGWSLSGFVITIISVLQRQMSSFGRCRWFWNLFVCLLSQVMVSESSKWNIIELR